MDGGRSNPRITWVMKKAGSGVGRGGGGGGMLGRRNGSDEYDKDVNFHEQQIKEADVL